MIKRILSDSFFYTLANLLTKGIGFIMIPIYTFYYSTKDYGIIDLVTISGSMLTIIIGLEIHQAVARFFPDTKNEEEKKVLVSTALWTILILYIIFVLIAFPFIGNISQIAFSSPDYKNFLYIAILSFGFNFIYYFFSSQLKWQLKSKQNVLVSFIYSVITASLTIVFLKYFNLSIISVFLAKIIAASICIFLSYLFTKEYYGFIFDLGKLKNLLSFSIPLVFSTLVVYAMQYIDRVMINSFLSIESVGLYGMAFRFASVTTMLTIGIQTALTPLIYREYKNKETPIAIARLFHYFLLAGSVFIAFLFFFSNKIILLVANENYIESSSVIPWLAMSILFSGVIKFVPGIFIAKKTKYILFINIFSLIVNIALNYFLIKSLGLLGAAYSTAISSFIYFLSYYFIGQKYYFIPFFWTELKFNNRGR